MSVTTISTIKTCSDCGQEFDNLFDHELTCWISNGKAHATPIVDGEIIGHCDFEPGLGEEVTFTCYLCKATVTQDAADDIEIDSKGNPLCSKVCRAADTVKELKAAQEPTELDKAYLAYALLDREEHIHKAYYAERAAALDRIISLNGIAGHFQDTDGVVYEVTHCSGRYVKFIPYEIKRTRRGDEKAGSLALTRAEELGYNVERKRAKAKAKPSRIVKDDIPF